MVLVKSSGDSFSLRPVDKIFYFSFLQVLISNFLSHRYAGNITAQFLLHKMNRLSHNLTWKITRLLPLLKSPKGLKKAPQKNSIGNAASTFLLEENSPLLTALRRSRMRYSVTRQEIITIKMFLNTGRKILGFVAFLEQR